MFKNTTLFLFTLLSFTSYSQDKLGIANSNYSVSNSIFLNPSSSSDSRSFLQINFVGANAFLKNNQAFLADFIVRKKYFESFENISIDTSPPKSFAYANVGADLPTAIYSFDRFGGGVFSRARAIVDVRNIPFDLSIAIMERDSAFLSQNIELDLRNVKVSEMAWIEHGINFSYILKKSGTRIISVGGNLKYLSGINIAYANLDQFTSRFKDTTIDISNYKAKARFNIPGWETGKGAGLDVGFTYKKMLDFVDAYSPNSQKSHCKFIDYKYKLGVSLLDLGTIRFTNNTYHVNSQGSTYISRFTNDSILINSFKVDTTTNKPIWATLPSTISAQVDYNFGNHFYGNVTIFQSITGPRMIGVQRQSLVSITPRYELKNFEFALPFTFHRYIYPMLGFSFRARSFVIGVDNVIPLIFKNDTYGGGVYFNLGLTLYKNPMCWNKRKKLKSKKLSFKKYQYYKEEKKKNDDADKSPDDAINKDDKKEDADKNKTSPEESKKSETNTKRRYKWLRKGKGKKNYKKSKTD